MEKEKNKIKLATFIVFILIGIFLLIIIIPEFVKDEKKSDGNILGYLNHSDELILLNNNLSNETPSIVKENMEDSFSFEFLKMENNKTNMIYSPLSIKYALNMLSEGANGETKIQIDNVLARLNFTKYKNIKKILSVANGIFIKDEYSKYVKQSFRENLINNLEAEVKLDNFKNAKKVNAWIEDKTFGILKDVLNDNIVTQSEMLLINALAIDMKWENEFDENDTFGREFTMNSGEKIIATTMSKETKSDQVSYYKDNNITALTMNLKKYENTQLEFMAIMPENNLDEYIKTVTSKDIDNITDKLIKTSDTKNGVDIFIPKFEFNYNLELKEDLQKLGIEDAFDIEKADFSNMAETSLYVNEAIHKADIKFSEEGIRAAAVTIFAMKENALLVEKDEPVRVNIDKPFLFLIRDKETGEIWFTGTVYEPNLWENDKLEYKK